MDENKENNTSAPVGNVNVSNPDVEKEPELPKTQEEIKEEETKDEKPSSGEKKKETVEVDKDVLDKLVKGYEVMEQKVQDLEGAADLGRLDKIKRARMDGKLVKSAKVNIYEGRVVLGWRKDKDDVYFDESGKLHEDQKIILILATGEKDKEGNEVTEETEPMSYRTFARVVTKQDGEVVKESTEADGQKFYTIQMKDGRRYELSIVFIN